MNCYFRNIYMLYLIFVNRSREIVNIMGHDVRQFKSLEGFLESGPQFVLQSYILLRGQKRGLEDIEQADASKENSTKMEDTEFQIRFLFSVRVIVLVASVIFSFFSLSKTGFNVNCPDPDAKRQSQQYPGNSRFFSITSFVFHVICVLFRVSCLAYFFAIFRVKCHLLLETNLDF